MKMSIFALVNTSSKSSIRFLLFILSLLIVAFNNPTNSGAVELTDENFDTLIANTELVFINFYADWCRFSNMLAPIFSQAADAIQKEFPDPTKVVLGRVDCDKYSSISSRYKVSKYPTLKLIRNGLPVKKEYRGARTVEAFTEFIRKALESPLIEFKSLQELSELDKTKKQMFVAYMASNDSKTFDSYNRIAKALKEECNFYVGFGDASKQMHPPDHDIIAFRPDLERTVESDETFKGNSENYDELYAWISSKCIPLVREITFENAEELTEEGLPFLILFHDPADTDSVKRYSMLVTRELLDEKQNINFLTADGNKFAHPLHHLGKSSKDLPLLAIDSFRHMYLFPSGVDMDEPGKVKQFIADLNSGKLHREFHYGPDTPTGEDSHGHAHGGDSKTNEILPTDPPESTFKKLGPSKNRYTLLKDEL